MKNEDHLPAVLLLLWKVGSGTGRDPDGTFRDPEPEIPDFCTTRDFSGTGWQEFVH
jgi:hypothetical protein